MAALAFFFLLAGLTFWITLPLMRKEDFRASEILVAGELKDLYALRDVAYDTLRDLEFDFGMGKMAESDYRELKTRYQGEAAEILRQIEVLEQRLEADRPSARRRGGKTLP
jgi:hypothetical protein